MSKPSPTPHPQWCARAHYCTATPASLSLPARGEHRSEPFRLDTTWGGIVATLVASGSGPGTGRPYLELRMSVHIPPQEPRARLRAQLIAHELAQAVDLALVEADIAYLVAADPTLHALPEGVTDREVTHDHHTY